MAYNFFYILKNNDERDFYYYEYLSILSIIHTQENYNIIIYRINNVNGKYYNLLKYNSNICFRDINIYVDNFNDKSNNYDKFKYSLINTVGGIYVDFNVIFVSSIKHFYSKHLFISHCYSVLPLDAVPAPRALAPPLLCNSSLVLSTFQYSVFL